MDAPNRQRYRTHFVMNTPRDGRRTNYGGSSSCQSDCGLELAQPYESSDAAGNTKSVDRISRVLSRKRS
mgnify:CR=1 FL=1